jgi:DNA-binding transcriptional ArsR family regulator
MTAPSGVLKALADPLRLRMGLLMIDEARTVKELAAALDVPPTRLYYHVRILEQHGLIEVVERRMVSGIEERRYQAVVANWAVGDDLRASTLLDSGVLTSLFGAVEAEMHVALHGQPDMALGDPASAVAFLSLAELRLNAGEVAEVQKRLEALIDEFAIDRPDAPDDAQRYHFLLAGYRRPGAA